MSFHSPHTSDLRVKEYNPAGQLQSKPIRPEEWNKHEARIRALHAAKYKRADALEQLRADCGCAPTCGFSPSPSQYSAQLKAWGLRTYKPKGTMPTNSERTETNPSTSAPQVYSEADHRSNARSYLHDPNFLTASRFDYEVSNYASELWSKVNARQSRLDALRQLGVLAGCFFAARSYADAFDLYLIIWTESSILPIHRLAAAIDCARTSATLPQDLYVERILRHHLHASFRGRFSFTSPQSWVRETMLHSFLGDLYENLEDKKNAEAHDGKAMWNLDLHKIHINENHFSTHRQIIAALESQIAKRKRNIWQAIGYNASTVSIELPPPLSIQAYSANPTPPLTSPGVPNVSTPPLPSHPISNDSGLPAPFGHRSGSTLSVRKKSATKNMISDPTLLSTTCNIPAVSLLEFQFANEIQNNALLENLLAWCAVAINENSRGLDSFRSVLPKQPVEQRGFIYRTLLCYLIEKWMNDQQRSSELNDAITIKVLASFRRVVSPPEALSAIAMLIVHDCPDQTKTLPQSQRQPSLGTLSSALLKNIKELMKLKSNCRSFSEVYLPLLAPSREVRRQSLDSKSSAMLRQFMMGVASTSAADRYFPLNPSLVPKPDVFQEFVIRPASLSSRLNSPRSSFSSGLNSMRATATKTMMNSVLSIAKRRSVASVDDMSVVSSRSSWSFGAVTGMPRAPPGQPDCEKMDHEAGTIQEEPQDEEMVDV